VARARTGAAQRRRQIDAFARLDTIMRLAASERTGAIEAFEAVKGDGAESPSGRAADIVLGFARPPAIEKKNR